jgi:predicted enzyme related to lactoylglutathione lyase
MRHAINWFEIPATDLDRATRFYEVALDQKLKREVFADTPMAVFAGDCEAVRGAIIHDAKRKPTGDGALVYLNVEGQLDQVLARIPKAGGAVVLPRTAIGEPGFIALVRDSEGNVVGLHSPT